VQIDKGPAKANESLKNVRSLIHCNICEDRAFYPDTNYVDGNFLVAAFNLRDDLNCNFYRESIQLAELFLQIEDARQNGH
jgi:hypothetical protein